MIAEHFLRSGLGQRLGAAAGRVLAAQEAVDDAVLEADEAGGAVVVLGEHAGDADQRQRTLALAGVEMTVGAGDTAAGQLRRFVRRVDEEAIAPLDLIGELRIEGRVAGRILRDLPRRHHRRARRDQRARRRSADARGRGDRQQRRRSDGGERGSHSRILIRRLSRCDPCPRISEPQSSQRHGGPERTLQIPTRRTSAGIAGRHTRSRRTPETQASVDRRALVFPPFFASAAAADGGVRRVQLSVSLCLCGPSIGRVRGRDRVLGIGPEHPGQIVQRDADAPAVRSGPDQQRAQRR